MDMMKKIILFILFVLHFGIAEVWHDAFENGNQFYRDGQYQEAIDAYTIALQNGMESGELYYNLGNTYFKLNEMGKARLYYEKAALLLKNDEAIQHNINLVNVQLVDQIPVPPKFILMDWWEHIINIFPLNILTWIVLGLFIVFLLFFGLKIYYRHRRGRFSFNFIYRIAATSLIVFLVILLSRIYVFETETFAIILKPKVTVYASPDNNGTEVFILHEGTKVRLLRTDRDWFEVKLDDGKTGWLENTYLEKI
jgi:tetratricopeptide (TPR) repeat protein